MLPAKFLKKYDTVVFEPDGVITNNRHFLICAVLSVYEMCHSNKYYGKSEMDCASVAANSKQICDLMLLGGKIPEVLAELGVDYPLDIAYVLFSVIMGTGERRDFANICSYFKYTDLHTPDIFDHCSQLLGKVIRDKDCSRGGEIWQTLRRCYNEWLFGDELFEMYSEGVPAASGKPSFILSDSLCVPAITLRDVLAALKNADKKIAVTTLRTRFEFEVSLKRWKLNEFTHENTVTLDDVLDAGHTPNINTPHEPDTYSIARAAIGPGYTETAHRGGIYDEQYSRTLVVSSSPISLFAAQALGMGFAAVIHNPTDKSRKDMFRQFEADYTLESITELTKPKGD